jgi:hypothetical protein
LLLVLVLVLVLELEVDGSERVHSICLHSLKVPLMQSIIGIQTRMQIDRMTMCSPKRRSDLSPHLTAAGPQILSSHIPRQERLRSQEAKTGEQEIIVVRR